jgi:hypothetical protein
MTADIVFANSHLWRRSLFGDVDAPGAKINASATISGDFESRLCRAWLLSV